MRALLFDVGSTFIKYGIYDSLLNTIIFQDFVPFPEPKIDDGVRFIIPSAKISDAVFDIFSKTSMYSPEKTFFSVQMHGYILKNPDGNFSDYVSWRDKSGDISGFSDVNFNLYGTALKNNLPLTKLFHKDIKGEFFTLGSFISAILTGNNITHITDACASGFFEVNSGKCNNFAKVLKMPKALMNVKEVGKYLGISVFAPVGDHQVSFFGSMAKDDKYLLNIGTATQISCTHSADFPDGNYEKRPYINKNLRLYTISGLVGGHKLYQGDGKDELLGQIKDALLKLPKKDGIILGGGGAKLVFEYLKENLPGVPCRLCENNIGMEGLKMLTDKTNIKLGTMLSEITFQNFPIIAKNSGLDFVILDNEHGYFDYSDIAKITLNSRLIGLDLIVRIGDSSRSHITKLADMGVRGFLLPMTNCSDDIAEVIKYARYYPDGKRGVSTTRAHTLYNPPSLCDYMKSANDEMKIYAQIETLSGIENIDSILTMPGISGVFIGPNDLSVDAGCIGDKAKILEYIGKILAGAKRNNMPAGVITADKDIISYSRENGASMFSIGSELNMLINGCKKIKEDF